MAYFFWLVVDAAARDREAGVSVLGEKNYQPWIERLLNIIGGHLKKNGFEEVWEQVCDEI